MSYILDALRRADAERERGEIPGLQSQQHTLVPEDEAPARSRAMVWAVVALSLALLAAVAWNFLGGDPPKQVAQDTAAPTALPVPTTLPVLAAPATMPPVSVATTAPTALPAPAASARVARRPPPATASAAAPRQPASTSSRLVPESRIYAQADLPDEIRREIPKLSIGGASYSGDAASRMVIINGQVFHEGDKIANGLVLEKIKLKSAVLAYKSWRYEITY
jgi:general secretion pathway protein B